MLYFVGRYQYREMKRPKLTASRDIDFLPPTMLYPIVRIEAPNRKEAIRQFRIKEAK